ncbi:hypothetical protein [Butyrivibrio sp. XPD2006]|uniref:hypothetical protein n=1 Tax=Butyrivibrio sp. XPD2006 TaxID=1280668 RepID=UPI0003B56C79|nr:hypothetical protein [Butyrivibrio sp. XPD2006]
MADKSNSHKAQLHNWYISEHEFFGKMRKIAHGIVTGHKKLEDSIYVHSSEVKAIHVDEEEEEMVITTGNSVYHCPLSYWDFKEQDEYPNAIPDYEQLKEKYNRAIEYPTIEPGKVLLVLANFCKFYFHSLYYVPEDSESGEPVDYSDWASIGVFDMGMNKDIYRIVADGCGIELRYFVRSQNIEFYHMQLDDCPLYIENIGNAVLYASTSAGIIRLDPGDRKEVTEENAE